MCIDLGQDLSSPAGIAKAQMSLQKQLNDEQLAAQQNIASQQEGFNEKQLQWQKDIQDQQQQQVSDQATRQNTYDAGRSQLLSEGAQSINDAFAKFSPDYYNQFTKDYMAKASDQIDYQQKQATKAADFAMARQGLAQSQANVNTQGLIGETAGRTYAEQTTAAQNAANQLRANVNTSKQNLLGQVTASESLGSPIAANDMGGVNTALQTQGEAITGVKNSAGDVTSSLTAVPTVSVGANIFGGLLSDVGSYMGGVNANTAVQANRNALAGGPSNIGSTSIR